MNRFGIVLFRGLLHLFFMIGLMTAAHAQVATGTDGANGQIDALTAAVVARHPANSIQSVAQADAALAEVARQRAQIEAQSVRDRQACNPTFFTTRCIDGVREHRRAALARLRPIEIEANALKRRTRVVERDRALAEKQRKAEQDAEPAQRELKIRKTPAEAGSPEDLPGQRRVRSTGLRRAPGVPAEERAEARARRHQQPLGGPIDAATQAQNMAAFDRKAAESAQRQREVAEKKAEKARDRARKKAEADNASGLPAAAAQPKAP